MSISLIIGISVAACLFVILLVVIITVAVVKSKKSKKVQPSPRESQAGESAVGINQTSDKKLFFLENSVIQI